jgi:nicotinamidase-related amidase
MAIWDPFLTAQDRAHLEVWGKRVPFGLGTKPALLVIDDYYSVLGLEREPILESIKKWPMSCGLEGWEAIDQTVTLIAAAREAGVPVIYARSLTSFPTPWMTPQPGNRHRGDLSRLTPDERSMANEIVAEVAPLPGELVIEKAAASAFQGTPLVYQLIHLGIDTVIVCGETTSGCVRATVVDAATHRFRVGVVEECCFDRTQAAHAINLFDMDQKYGDVIPLSEAVQYFASVRAKELVGAA